MSAAERDSNGKLWLRNMPTAASRQLLSVRVNALLASFKDHDRREIAIAVMEMLASYDVAQSKQLTAAERKAAVTVYVRELQGVPTWAILEACNKIRLGTASEISHTYKPTPIQLRVLAVEIASPWKREALQIGEILTAEKYQEGPSEEERGRVAVKMRTLADELKGELVASERQRDEPLLRRYAEQTDKAIKREWGDQEPPKAGELMISRSLVDLIEAQKKAPTPPAHDPMVL